MIFEAGLFGGVLGMCRTFILHPKEAKFPTDLLGLTSIRYNDAKVDAEVEVLNEKLRQAIESHGHIANIEGFWWQFSLTQRSSDEPSAVSLLRIWRNHNGTLEIAGRAWQENGILSARYCSEASKERTSLSGIFYYFRGERPKDPNAPAIEGTGEILVESADRAAGYFTTRSETNPSLLARTSGVYLPATLAEFNILNGSDNQERANLIVE